MPTILQSLVALTILLSIGNAVLYGSNIKSDNNDGGFALCAELTKQIDERVATTVPPLIAIDVEGAAGFDLGQVGDVRAGVDGGGFEGDRREAVLVVGREVEALLVECVRVLRLFGLPDQICAVVGVRDFDERLRPLAQGFAH